MITESGLINGNKSHLPMILASVAHVFQPIPDCIDEMILEIFEPETGGFKLNVLGLNRLALFDN